MMLGAFKMHLNLLRVKNHLTKFYFNNKMKGTILSMNENIDTFLKKREVMNLDAEVIFNEFKSLYFDEMISEIRLINLINICKSEEMIITRLEFMKKFNLLERGFSYTKNDLFREDEKQLYEHPAIQSFNEHFSNLTLTNKLSSIASNNSKFENLPISNIYQARTLMALKLGDTDLCFTKRSDFELQDLNRIQKLLSYKISSLYLKDDDGSLMKKVEIPKPKIRYQEALKIYNYYIEELQLYPDIIARIESLLQVENDNGFILYTELCKFIRIFKNYNSQVSKKRRLDKNKLDCFFRKIKIYIMDIDLPATKISIIRTINNLLLDYRGCEDPDVLLKNIADGLIFLSMKVNRFVEEEIKEFVREIARELPYTSAYQKNPIKLKIANVIVPYGYIFDCILEEKMRIEQILVQQSFHNKDFKDVDIATFTRINSTTEVRLSQGGWSEN